MNALIGLVLIQLFVVLTVALYVDCRRPKLPFWAGDTVVFTVEVPALVALLAAGGGFIIDAAMDWEQHRVTLGDLPAILTSFAITALLLVLLRPRKRLAQYVPPRAAPPPPTLVASAPRLGTDRDTDPHLPKAA